MLAAVRYFFQGKISFLITSDVQAGQGASGDSGRQRCRSVDGQKNKQKGCRTGVMLGKRKSRRLADVFLLNLLGQYARLTLHKKDPSDLL